MHLSKRTETYRSVVLDRPPRQITVQSESDMVSVIYNGSVFEMTLDQAVGIRDALTLITDDIKKEIEDNG
jgi:uncharacterized protein (DUF427 family)